jgi:hypothetical protein
MDSGLGPSGRPGMTIFGGNKHCPSGEAVDAWNGKIRTRIALAPRLR